MNVEINKHSSKHNGRYFMETDGTEPELTFIYIPFTNDIVANHTRVPVQFRGKGLARELVEAMIKDARENDFKIVPECSYIERLYQRHPEWSGVMRELPAWAV